jgi:hypothetical protein
MGFPCLWDNFGGFAVWDPKLWIMATISSKRHVYQRNHYVWCIIYHSRKSRLTCRLHGENGRTETQKFDKRPPRGGATAQPTQQICTLIKCTPGLGHPCPIWFWSVDAFLFHRGSNFPCFQCIAERPIQQCFALPCSAVMTLSWGHATLFTHDVSRQRFDRHTSTLSSLT